jgi:hypothetical protein
MKQNFNSSCSKLNRALTSINNVQVSQSNSIADGFITPPQAKTMIDSLDIAISNLKAAHKSLLIIANSVNSVPLCSKCK